MLLAFTLLLTLLCADQTVDAEIHSGSTSIYWDFNESPGCSMFSSTFDIINYPAGKPTWAKAPSYGFLFA
jgi:hypothetical protein